MDFSKTLAPSLLVSMFVISGLHKTQNLQKTLENVAGKLNVSGNIATLGVFLVIVLETIAPAIIIYYIITQKYKEYAVYSVWSLILFTIIVTAIYHPPDFSNYYKSVPFWANVSLLGGLLLLEQQFR
jgi:uncharacterized membrane protein YphA (DoxX/SURF4 family)